MDTDIKKLPTIFPLIDTTIDDVEVDYMHDAYTSRTTINRWILIICKILMYPLFFISDLWDNRNPIGNACFALYFSIIGTLLYFLMTTCILPTYSLENVFIIQFTIGWYIRMVSLFLIT